MGADASRQPLNLRALVAYGVAGDSATALGYAEPLAAISPDDRTLAELIEEFLQAAKGRPIALATWETTIEKTIMHVLGSRTFSHSLDPYRTFAL